MKRTQAAPRSLSAAQRVFVHVAATLVYASGLLRLAAHYALPYDAQAMARHPLEAQTLAAHGAAAMAFLVALGSLLPRHIPEGWRARRNVVSGVAMIATAAWLAASGWALYYLGSETLHESLGLAHWLGGVAAGPLALMHFFSPGAAAKR